ncbi:MAG: SMI1/KNR4 family protein [Myxococcales bacterium]|nr:SMI1/KNR4 family protein [Myxococcales bacterium]
MRDEDLAQAERLLGCALPASVRALHEVIGNGSGVILSP